jgi:hypothetical protein|tara:strand:+ start:1025 stop:1303 length:279 start_codon:yes stop_codon:yes gene_type:complete
MSIVFKPTIRFNFASGKMQPKTKTVNRESVYWTTFELSNLVELRSIGLSYKDCAKLLGKSQYTCCSAADSNNLHSRITKRKKELIDEALKPK